MSTLEHCNCKRRLKKNNQKWEQRRTKHTWARADISFYNSYVDKQIVRVLRLQFALHSFLLMRILFEQSCFSILLDV